MTQHPGMTPRLDAMPQHTCGTLYRAGVITRGCTCCQPAALATVLLSARGTGRGLR